MGSVSLVGPPWVLRCVASSSRAPSILLTRPTRRGYRRLPEHGDTLPSRVHQCRRQTLSGVAVSHHPKRRISTFSPISNEHHPISTPPSKQPAASPQTPYSRLSPVLQALPGPIDWGVAYGSGVITQANSSSTPSLVDFLVSTHDPSAFHQANLTKHPSHYPFYARWAGGSAIADWQERWGAGVWYVTNVHVCGMEVKYGVISTTRLRQDLESWETLYVAGRLQKPILPLRIPRALESALEHNLKAALSLALLYLEQEFTEMQLWEEVAGISYSGDPRMSVPGAENPQKVKNIVRGPGVQEGFREMYGGLLREMTGVHGGGVTGEKGVGEAALGGATAMTQSSNIAHRITLFQALPAPLQSSVTRRLTSGASKKPELEKIISDPLFKETLQAEVGKIIRRPALTQSLKGLFTAGPTKSFWYGLAKARKWWAGRSKPS